MCKVTSLCILLYSLVHTSARSQNGFGGYIVVGKDTVRGVLSENIISGSDYVSIQTDGSSFKNYPVSEVSLIRLNNGSVFVPAKSIGFNRDIFLVCLVEGTASLFSYHHHANDFYIIVKESQPTELDNSIQTITRNGVVVAERPSNRYRGQLRLLLGDAKQLDSKFEKTPYNAKALSSLVRQYNAIVTPYAPTHSFSYRQAFLKTNVGFVVGGGYPMLSVDDFLLDYYAISSPDFKSNTTYSAGAVVLVTSRVVKNVWIGFRPAFSKTTYKSIISYTNFNHVYNEIEFKLTGIHLPLSIGYAFPTSNVKPFAEIGLWRTYFTSSTSDFQYTITPPSGSPLKGSYDSFKFADYQSGFVVAAGIKVPTAQKNDIMFTLKYEQGKGIHYYNTSRTSKAYKTLSSTKAILVDISILF